MNIKCRNNKIKNKESRNKRDRNDERRNYDFSFSSVLLFLFAIAVVFDFKSFHCYGDEGNATSSDISLSNSSTCEDKRWDNLNTTNESNNTSNRTLFNITLDQNDSSVLDHDSFNSNYSLRVIIDFEDTILNALGYATLMCELQPHEEIKTKQVDPQQNGRTHPTYPNLDEFRNITMIAKSRVGPSRLVNMSHRLDHDGNEYNYASASKGAKVLAHNKECKGASNILGKDHDKYLRNPCSASGKFVVVDLAEETLVDVVKIANFEHYSSNFKEFELLGSLSYPTETWFSLGNFVASNVKHLQSFKVLEPKWVRYLKLNLSTHYGSEFYCTLSVLEVFGVDAIEQMLEDLIVASEEPSANKIAKLNSTNTPSINQELNPSEDKGNGIAQNKIEIVEKGIEKNNSNLQEININVTVNPVIVTEIPDPLMGVRQVSSGRIPGDTVLKILMQKVKSLEINFSVLEEYIKEVNRRHGDVFPELDKELLRLSLLLEKSRTEIKDLIEWKAYMDKGISEIESWKVVVSSQVDALVRENSMMRLDVEKVVNDQTDLENKELAVLAVSFCFITCLAILKLLSSQLFVFLRVSQFDKKYKTSRGWLMILICSVTIILIILLFS